MNAELSELKKQRISVVNEIHELLGQKSDTVMYAEFERITETEENYILRGTLCTSKMLSFCERLFSYQGETPENEEIDIFRPIFFGFVLRVPKKRGPEERSRNDRDMRKYLYEPFSAALLRDLLETAKEIAKEIAPAENPVLIAENILRKYEFSVRFDPYGLDADVYFAASPYWQIRKKLLFVHPHLSVQKKSLKQKVENMIQQRVIPLKSHKPLPAINPDTLQILNVGQGNFICLYDSKTKKTELVSDVGFTSFEKHDAFPAKDYIPKIDCGCYVISHFDTDHILGCIYLQSSQFTKSHRWYIRHPKYVKEISVSALMFIRLLLFADLYVIDTLQDPLTLSQNPLTLSQNPLAELYYGTGKGRSKAEINNNIGLILRIQTGKDILLPGDCMYHAWGSARKQKAPLRLDYLVIPHHCCALGKRTNQIVQGKQGAIAVASVGSNSYGHPDAAHIAKLNQWGFTVVETNTKIKIKQVKKRNIKKTIKRNNKKRKMIILVPNPKLNADGILELPL